MKGSGKTARFALMASCAVLFFIMTAVNGNAEERKMKFSKEELELIRDIDNIEKGAGMAKHMLAIAPILEVVSADAVDVVVTLTTNDWDMIPPAIGALNKIKSCELDKLIFSWKEVDGNNYSSKETEEMFEAIKSSASAGCK